MTSPHPPPGTEPGTLHWLIASEYFALSSYSKRRNTVAIWNGRTWRRIGAYYPSHLSGWTYLGPAHPPGDDPLAPLLKRAVREIEHVRPLLECECDWEAVSRTHDLLREIRAAGVEWEE